MVKNIDQQLRTTITSDDYLNDLTITKTIW